MHQVDTALAHFERIVGLREGTVAFDLPTAQVSRDHLLRLYAQHEDELDGAPGGPTEASNASDASSAAAPRPVVMHCR